MGRRGDIPTWARDLGIWGKGGGCWHKAVLRACTGGTGQAGMLRQGDRPCRFLARIIPRAPYQKWRLSTDSSVTSVPSHLLARGRHALLRVKKEKNHYVELACLQWFNWNKMCAPLSGTACAEEPG